MTETGWLIGQYVNNKLYYWRGGQAAQNLLVDQKCGSWTTNVYDAINFAREQDAKAVLFHLLDGSGRVVEHGWIAQEPQA